MQASHTPDGGEKSKARGGGLPPLPPLPQVGYVVVVPLVRLAHKLKHVICPAPSAALSQRFRREGVSLPCLADLG